MNNKLGMGIIFYPTLGGKKPTPISQSSSAGNKGVGSTGGGSALSSMRGGNIGPDETFFMVKRARTAAGKKLTSKAPSYRVLGGVAEQRIPDGNVLDTIYGVRVGGVNNHMEFPDPKTRINSDAIKVWNAQLKSSRTFELDREAEWTGRPQSSITTIST